MLDSLKIYWNNFPSSKIQLLVILNRDGGFIAAEQGAHK